MTDKKLLLREVTETGFYCAVDDIERLYVFEVINNTDEEWLKENPEDALLIDEWIYDYTDYDDRKVYGTSGNLVSIRCDVSTCKVYKIEDTKYKIYKSGLYLIEDKPTYKEQVQAQALELEKVKEKLLSKEQECEESKQYAQDVYDFWQSLIESFNILQDEKIKLERECLELRERLSCNCFDPKSNNNRCASYNRIAEDYERDLKRLDQLRADNETLKQYKASKQASYESMQREWNRAVNANRELKAENANKTKRIKELLHDCNSCNFHRYQQALIKLKEMCKSNASELATEVLNVCLDGLNEKS